MKLNNLKNKILQLAIQGKLVSQDGNDESASILLQKIKEEKEKLIKEKKIKKEKALPEISEEEKTFEIPKGWEWCRFSEPLICRDGERKPVSSKDRSEREKIYDYYGASGVIDKIDDFIFNKPLLLIGEDGANLISRTTPIAFIAEGEYWVNNHAHVLDSIDVTILKYFKLYINAIDLKPYVTGTAQPKLNQANMNRIVVAFPPLEEQKRIVAKVNELFAIVDELNANKEEMAKVITKTRKKVLQLAIQGKLVPQGENDEPASVLLEKIQKEKEQLIKEKKIKKEKPLPEVYEDEKLFELPSGWKWCRIEKLISLISGRDLETSKCNSDGIGTPYIMGASNMTDEGLIIERWVEKPTVIGENGDIMLSVKGTVGKLEILKLKEVHLSRQVMSLRVISNLISNQFLLTYLKSYMEKLKDKSSGVIPGISRESILSIPIALPPLFEQKRIVAKVDEIMNYLDSLEKTLLA